MPNTPQKVNTKVRPQLFYKILRLVWRKYFAWKIIPDAWLCKIAVIIVIMFMNLSSIFAFLGIFFIDWFINARFNVCVDAGIVWGFFLRLDVYIRNISVFFLSKLKTFIL